MAYSAKVLDHYENPRNAGSFSKDEENIGTGLVGAPACGDLMKLQIKVDNKPKLLYNTFLNERETIWNENLVNYSVILDPRMVQDGT